MDPQSQQEIERIKKAMEAMGMDGIELMKSGKIDIAAMKPIAMATIQSMETLIRLRLEKLGISQKDVDITYRLIQDLFSDRRINNIVFQEIVLLSMMQLLISSSDPIETGGIAEEELRRMV